MKHPFSRLLRAAAPLLLAALPLVTQAQATAWPSKPIRVIVPFVAGSGTDTIARKFPPLAGIGIDYSWWGWVDVSHDMMPRITQPDPGQSIWYSIGYGGNGVSFSTLAGRRLAERVAGKDGRKAVFELPIYNSPLPFPNLFGQVESALLAPFRRLGQRALYKWYWLRDEKL